MIGCIAASAWIGGRGGEDTDGEDTDGSGAGGLDSGSAGGGRQASGPELSGGLVGGGVCVAKPWDAAVPEPPGWLDVSDIDAPPANPAHSAPSEGSGGGS